MGNIKYWLCSSNYSSVVIFGLAPLYPGTADLFSCCVQARLVARDSETKEINRVASVSLLDTYSYV
jgi:hypothetical protein